MERENLSYYEELAGKARVDIIKAVYHAGSGHPGGSLSCADILTALYFGEMKKPTQHSVKELQGMGINPDIIVLRCDNPLEEEVFRKISLFCNVREDCVIENRTLPNLYWS